MSQLSYNIFRAIEYVETSGLVIRRNVTENVYSKPEHVPFTLEPSALRSKTFQTISELQKTINRLIHRASQDDQFVRETLENVILTDEFWRKMYDVYVKSKKCGTPCPFELGLHRTDYLIERSKSDEQIPLMVEINTIASSMGGHAVGVGKMHRAIGTCPINAFTDNNVIQSLACGIADGVRNYAKYYSKSLSDLCVITLREEGGSVNFSDQRRVEMAVQEELLFQVQIYRNTLGDFCNITPKKDGSIHYKEKEIAVFYLRTGYDPACYKTEASWDARLQIENSRAIKTPSITYHLLTNKVFQAKFTDANVLRKFLSKEETISLSSTFCEMVETTRWDDPRILAARNNSADYCLKILREGGADGNLFRDEIIPVLDEMETDFELRTKYVLMKLIKPEVVMNTIVRAGNSFIGETISEFGVFGIYLHDTVNDQMVINSNDGHLVRTKPASSDKGGVAVGAAAISSIALI